MGEFFKPWRRKIGVMTLVIACVFAAGWVRSVSTFEQIEWRTSQANTCLIASGGQSLGWVIYSDTESSRPLYSLHDQGINFRIPAGVEITISKRAPYWSVVLPITLLSACLLLTKPISSTPMKIAEPISTSNH